MNQIQTAENQSSARSLRFGIMCTGTTFEEWQARCLEELLGLDGVSCVLLILDVESATSSFFEQARQIPFRRWPFVFYNRIVAKPRALRSRDLSPALGDVPKIRCRVIRKGKYSQYFRKDELEAIRGHNLDFVLRFGFNIIRGEILTVPTYGVWSFHHDDEEKYRGAPPCYWEIARDDPITGAILQRLTDRLDGGIVLKKGRFKTISYSYARNMDNALFGSARWPAQVCSDLQNGHAAYLNASPSKTSAPIYRHPTNLQLVFFVLKIIYNLIAESWKAMFQIEQWNVGIVKHPIEGFLDPAPERAVAWYPTLGRNRFIADPFVVGANGAPYLFFEEYDHRVGSGVISALELSDESEISMRQTVLQLPVHLSHPYVFSHEGDFYLIPETYQAREIGLYKAILFPSRWTKIAALLEDVAAIDATPFQHDGYWWLTFTDMDTERYRDLFVWYARDLLGPWKPHATNPVKTDISAARPAGTPFLHDGFLYRPAQDCSKTYGGQVVINRVLRLTPTEFEEEPAAVIAPGESWPFRDGVHTLSGLGDFTVIDAKRHLFSVSGFPRVLKKQLDRILRARVRGA